MGPFLKYVALVEERIERRDRFPFSIPAVGGLGQLDLHAAVTFFVGENGSGKSTLLEAMAVVEGFNLEGGSRNYSFATHQETSILSTTIRLGRGTKLLKQSDGFFLRGESLFNFATEAQRLGFSYGNKWLHDQSHGESFLTILLNRFKPNGLYFLDEPESALSPLRQLSFLRRMHDLVQQDCQFVIATHSPILMAYPQSKCYWFSSNGIEPIHYRETDHFRITKNCLEHTERVLGELFAADEVVE
jgi:predicted ATPase